MTAPTTGPQSEPRPPRIAISTIQTPNVDPANASSLGSMKPARLPTGPPASPRKNAATHHATTLERVVCRPIASALPSSSRIAFRTSPKRRA